MRPWIRFAVRELGKRPRVATYTLRMNGLKAVVRHPLLDAWIVEEIFSNGAYHFPEEVRLSLAPIADRLRIVDLGGHVGLFGLWSLGVFPGAHIVSFEPDPSNLTILRRCIAANGFDKRWRVVPAAAGTAAGSTHFLGNHHLSHVADQAVAIQPDALAELFPFLKDAALTRPQAHQVQVVDCFDDLAVADLIKIDIEGGEWALLDDPRFESLNAAAIVMECHRASSPDPDVIGCVTRRLSACGYRAHWIGGSGEADVVWALRAKSPPAGL